MSEKTYIDLGQVTAYAYAKAHGYTGTEEEFGIEQAQFAQNAQQVAEDRVVVREDRTHVDDVVETFTETTAPEAVQSVTTEGDTQVARVQGVGNAAVQDVNDTKDQALQDIDDAGDSEVSDIQAEGNTQIGLVRAEGTTQVNRVTQTGNTQVGLVQDEGATQVQNVEDKGQEIIDSLPPNYEEDMAQVEDFLENLVKVSDTQPSSEANKLWIEDQAEEEIEVPTYEEFESLSNDVSDALNALNAIADNDGIPANIEWEQGSIGNGGAMLISTTRVRTADYIPVKQGEYVVFDLPSGYWFEIDYYNSTKTWLNADGWIQENKTIYCDGSFAYLKLLLRNSANTDITPTQAYNSGFSSKIICKLVDKVYMLTGGLNKALTNINDGNIVWVQGGIGSAGEDYDTRNTSIRTAEFVNTEVVFSITSNAQFTSGYIALYNSEKVFVVRKEISEPVLLFIDNLLVLYPTAKYFRLEIGGVSGDVSKYNRLIVTGNEFQFKESRLDTIQPIYSYTDYHSSSSIANEGKRFAVGAYNVGKYTNDTDIYGTTTSYISNQKLHNLKNVIADMNADVLIINEDLGYIDGNSTKSSHDYVFRPVYPFVYGSAREKIYSKTALSNTSTLLTPNNRYVSFANITVDSKTVLVVCVHALAGITEEIQEKRAADLTWLLGKISEMTCDYCIIAGDFNPEAGTPDLEDMEEQFGTANMVMCNGGYFDYLNTWFDPLGKQSSVTIARQMPLDYVVTSNNVVCNSFKVYSDRYYDLYSDHVPIVADLTLLASI